MKIQLHGSHQSRIWTFQIALAMTLLSIATGARTDLAQYPLFMGGDVVAPPLTMLIMGRDHTLYYEAYNDASDLSGDGVLDVGYKPNMVDADGQQVDYFGYFDSRLCYDYSDGRFTPISATSTKKCPGHWSGDFLNYVTTARIDALRKVLYGGRRIIDEGSEADGCLPDDCLTVLERSYIPQDAHSWGKEYKSPEHDGYEISDYTPLSTPVEGTRHLFANATLLKTGNKEPLLRVLNDSRFRIWEWVAIERPVAGSNCVNSSTSCASSATTQHASHPSSSSTFATLITEWATNAQQCGTGDVVAGLIDDNSGNPFSSADHCSDDYYLTIVRGQIYVPSDGDYQFATNGDDAVEVLIDGAVVTGWYGGHGAKTDVSLATRATNTTSVATVALTSGWHPIEFHHEEATGGDSYELLWQPPSGSWMIVPATNLRGPDGTENTVPQVTTYSTERSVPTSSMNDYIVRVEVCNKTYPDAVCKAYPAGTLKPTGVLQRYGESDEMLFGLLTGSYGKNMAGGVLRKNIESLRDEIDPQTGQFTSLDGIVRTIDQFRIIDFSMTSDYAYTGGWRATSSMVTGGYFPDWGNPIGEMVYEALRYFSGKESPTSAFMPALTSGKERVTLKDYSGSSTMDLPAPAWRDPYYDYIDNGDGTFTKGEATSLYCSPGAQLIISDVNPSYDTDQVPGSYFASFSSDLTIDAAGEANAIWGLEPGSGLHFIGQSDSTYDGAPSAKTVTGLGNIRGLSPSEPTKQGGYYTAGVARYGFEEDLRDDVQDKQDINTFSVALASPLPRIEIPVGDGRVTVVPFAKSVGGYSINPDPTYFQPTNTIVDFFIETFANTAPDGSDENLTINEGRPYIKFRINYEDVEQGADHDMDAIVSYELAVNASDQLTVTLNSEYAAGSIIQHMGYVISGTTADGVYLEVRDKDTTEGSDPDYFLDTHAGLAAGECAVASPPSACDSPLPLVATRIFDVGSDAQVATVLENPLWYAAKYGSEGNENLAAGEPSPNYFLVTNAGTLQEQLETAFESIILLGKSSASAIAVDSVRIDTETLAFQAQFDSQHWSGTVMASNVDDTGRLSEPVWNSDTVGLPSPSNRHIFTLDPGDADHDPAGIAFDWASLTDAQKSALGTDATEQQNILNWLRGERSLEGSGVDDLREREFVLGDIVNSNPMYDKTSSTLYVGANDGMLHAFNADTGEEFFAYVPNTLFPSLKALANQGYTHRYYVDGSPSVTPISDTQSILIGTLAAGGRAIFALDVSDPENFTADDVLWEITETQPDDDGTVGPDYAELGFMIGQMTPTPVIGWWNNQWVVIFGNGVDSGTGATLFVANALTGALVDKLTVSTETDNGLSGAALVLDANNRLAAAYAGDLKGNLWKFDFTGDSLRLAANGNPLFVAQDADGNRQPITAPVNLIKHPQGGNIVAFGTGQYMRVTDPANILTQTAYGVWDNAKLQRPDSNPEWQGGTSTDRGSLLQQTFLYEDVIGDRKWRVVSTNAMDWEEYRGWFIDLISPEDGEQGERINYQANIIPGTGEIMFTSIVPTSADDPCMAGTAYRWIFLLDYLTGSISDWTRFDVNEDGVFDIDDVKKIADPNNPDAEVALMPYMGFTTAFGGAGSPGGRDTDVIILDERLIPGGPPRQSWLQVR